MIRILALFLTVVSLCSISYGSGIPVDIKNMLLSCLSAPGPAVSNSFKTLSNCVQVAMASQSFDNSAIQACNQTHAGTYLQYRTQCYQAIADKVYASPDAKIRLQTCVFISDTIGFGGEALNCFASAND